MDEISIVDRVAVEVDGIGDFRNHAAIPAVEDLEAVYLVTGSGEEWHQVRRVHGFTAAGHPLVLGEKDNHLVRAWEYLSTGWRFLRVQRVECPALSGPFTLAPPGMVAVFEDGSRTPVVFYDVLGRAVLMSGTKHRELYLAEDDDELVRIDGGPVATHDESDTDAGESPAHT